MANLLRAKTLKGIKPQAALLDSLQGVIKWLACRSFGHNGRTPGMGFVYLRLAAYS